MDEIKCIKVSEENLEEIKTVLGDSYYIRLSSPPYSCNPAEFVIMESKTQKGFVVKKGAILAFDQEKQLIYLLPGNNSERNYFYEVQEV